MNFLTAAVSRRAVFGKAAGILLCLSLVACAGQGTAESVYIADEAEQAPATYYLVRHAEKELTGDDPVLSAAGYARAEALAAVLSGIKFDGIYSTDTRRTRDTAAPTLAATNLTLQLYNGRALKEFAQELLTLHGNYLIVGHSNTTPQLVEALGGEGGDPIVEADEYDRLYVLTRSSGVMITEVRRYP